MATRFTSQKHDKIFAASVTLTREETYRIGLREIDLSLRVVGPMIEWRLKTGCHRKINRLWNQQVFAPMARIEEADIRSAQLRIRVAAWSPNLTIRRDLSSEMCFQPFVRRDDRNGVPTLLQNNSWTYVAITQSDNVRAESAIFTGIRSSLAGRKNRGRRKFVCVSEPPPRRPNLN